MRARFVSVVSSLLLLAACREELVCPSGESECEGRCVALSRDAANCGACGSAVGVPLEMCRAGAAACAFGVGECGGACTDLAHDPDHCGDCATACGAGEFCVATTGGTCTTTGACPAGHATCGRTCVDLASDRFHCGACANACAAGEACHAGSCRAAVYAACINTTEVVPLSYDLEFAGAEWSVPAGPTALALRGGTLYSANGWPAASLSILPLDHSAGVTVPFVGSDLQHVLVHGDALLVSNAMTGSIVVVSPDGAALGEIPMPDQANAPNPHGVAISGTSAYVALYGSASGGGQTIAKLDVSGLAACAAPDPGAPACGAGGACDPGRTCVEGVCRLVCGEVTATIDLLAVPGASDPPHLPTPSDVVAAAGLVFVGLSNLADDPTDGFPFFVTPKGPGRLAVIDPSAGDAVSLLDLGAGCVKPGPLALRGSTLWVGCGSLAAPDVAPGAVVPIDLSSGVPSVGAPIDVSPVVPSALAFCGGLGYVADQASGAVLTFDPDTGTTLSKVTVCPTDPFGFVAVADLACTD
jgi:hypothetical protein